MVLEASAWDQLTIFIITLKLIYVIIYLKSSKKRAAVLSRKTFCKTINVEDCEFLTISDREKIKIIKK